uniref:Uncharacterized protein n=1 Tax=Glossina brevipalpis TaxID=37001 RepID=A0A1A9W688_9MUSC
MLCYAMLWYAMLRCAVLCYAILCYAMLCCAMLCCAVLCCDELCCAVLCFREIFQIYWGYYFSPVARASVCQSEDQNSIRDAMAYENRDYTITLGPRDLAFIELKIERE